MLASYDWRVRHAGLMAIAAIREGTRKVRRTQSLFSRTRLANHLFLDKQVMQNELGKIIEYVLIVSSPSIRLIVGTQNELSSLVVPMFPDSHPRVRYAACQCVSPLRSGGVNISGYPV